MQQQKTQLKEDALYICKNGKLVPLDTPPNGFGTQELVWQNAKLQVNRVNYTQKFDK